MIGLQGTPRWLALLVFLACVLGAEHARALPVFARNYETSCQTCHAVYPKLTPFGEAFRRNGYRFPAGEDEDASVDDPIPLGHEAHKKVFPDAVWPGAIPGQVPLSAQMGARALVTPEQEPEVLFAQMGGDVALNAAAALHEAFSVWAGVGVRAAEGEAAEVELERVFAVVKPFDEPLLNLRLGRIEPGITLLSIHRTLGFSPWLFTTPVGDNPFTIEPAQVGFEATGVVVGRLTYSVGVVEGGGDRPNVDKDLYSRLAIKLGGMRLDGVGGATEPEPWRETSLTLGPFAYLGSASIGDPEVASQLDRFFIVGGDLLLSWRDLNLYGAYAFGKNQRPSLLEPDEETNSHQGLGQVDYLVFPWLVPTLRYERRKRGSEAEQRLSGGLYFLLRANIRAELLAAVDDAEDDFELRQVLTGMRLAF